MNTSYPLSERLIEAGNPKKSAFYANLLAGTAIASALVNFVPSADTPFKIGEEAQPPKKVSHIESVENTRPGEIAVKTEQGPSLEIGIPALYGDGFQAPELQKSAVDQISDYYSNLTSMLHKDKTITSIEISIAGSASDEDIAADPLAGLGQAYSGNDALALTRANLVKSSLMEDALIAHDKRNTAVTLDVPTGSEHILNSSEITEISQVAVAHGMTVSDLIQGYNYAQQSLSLTPQETVTMESYLDFNRNVRLESIITRQATPEIGACDIVLERTIENNKVDTIIPGHGGWQFKFAPWMLPVTALRIRRKKSNVQQEDEPVPEQDTKEATATSADTTVIKDTASPTESTSVGESRPATTLTEEEMQERYDQLLRKYLNHRSSNERRWLSSTAKVGAGLIALAIVFPWPKWSTDQAEPVAPTNEPCLSTETTAGSEYKLGLTFPVIDMIEQAFGGTPTTYVPLIDTITPNHTTITHAAHDVIYVDNAGAVLDREHFGKITEESFTTPHFAKSEEK